jgi:uncharacterized phiE125 gp8 family phage protein
MIFRAIPQNSPEEEPVSLAQAKEQLRIEHEEEDAHISSLISAARDAAEKYCNRFFAARSVLIYVEKANEQLLNLRIPDITEINEINYFIDGVETLIPSVDYTLLPARSSAYSVGGWPTSSLGYEALVDVSPPSSFDAVKIAILMLITDLYELRTESVLGVSIAKNPAVVSLLQPYRVDIGI